MVHGSSQEKIMLAVDRETAKKLFQRFRTKRDGIRNSPEMASVCLICGSIHIIPKPGDGQKLICRDCGFPFFRYTCSICGKTVDGRDPMNPLCRECGFRVCTCGACGCQTDKCQTPEKENTDDSGRE
jgi:DNA-directed RNA polymerase subunit RPC12/RpoP